MSAGHGRDGRGGRRRGPQLSPEEGEGAECGGGGEHQCVRRGVAVTRGVYNIPDAHHRRAVPPANGAGRHRLRHLAARVQGVHPLRGLPTAYGPGAGLGVWRAHALRPKGDTAIDGHGPHERPRRGVPPSHAEYARVGGDSGATADGGTARPAGAVHPPGLAVRHHVPTGASQRAHGDSYPRARPNAFRTAGSGGGDAGNGDRRRHGGRTSGSRATVAEQQ
eukprot:8244471-Pyramimonas_sp.AAC.2